MKSLILAAILSAGILAPQANLTGAWTITGDVQGYPLQEDCTLVHTDAKLSGSCVSHGKTYDTTGTVDGTRVVFKHGGEYQGDPLTLTFTGILADAGTFNGSIFVDPMAVDGTFSAKKAVATPVPGL